MKIALDELRAQIREVLLTSGASEKDVDSMTWMQLEQDLHGNYFSGVSEVGGALKELQTSVGKTPQTVVDKPAIKLINANGRNARLVGLDIIDELARTTKQQGIAMVGTYNGGYNGMLEIYARALAAQDLIGIVSSSGGPQGVVPFGGNKDIMGTNPLAYALPTHDLPIAFDAATSKYPYGAMARALERGETLPERSFLDKQGAWTTNPAEAVAIIPFGEHRGYAINLLLEVMAGALVQAKSGLLQRGEDDLGCFYIAIDPAAFGDLDAFKDQTTQLASDIEAVKPAEGYDRVAVPGYTGERRKQAAVAEGFVEVDERAYQKFKELYKTVITDRKAV